MTTRERQFASFMLVASFVAACAPSPSLDDRPCPCAEGYRCCNVLSAGAPSTAEPICVAQAACDARLSVSATSVRQGGPVSVTVEGTGLVTADVVGVLLRDAAGTNVATLEGAARRSSRDARLDVELTLPHSVAPGEYTLVLPVRLDSSERSFEAPIRISFISVSPTGSDASRGTRDAPFATLARAFAVAGKGDTVDLAGDATYGSADAGARLSLPAGLTLQSDRRRATVHAALDLAGDATIRGVELTTLDAHLRHPRTWVTLDDVRVDEGGPAGALVVEASAWGSTIFIQGKSTLTATDVPLVASFADDVTLNVLARSTLETSHAAEAIVSHGRAASLNLGDGIAPVSILSWGKDALFEDGGEAQINVRGAAFAGFLHVAGDETNVSAVEAKFNASGWELTAGIRFAGAHMFVSDSEFHGMGIEQNRAQSQVTLRRVRFSYQSWGYHLTAGSLDLGHGQNPGYNEFRGDDDSAVALWIDGEDGASAVTSCMSKVDGDVPTPFTAAEPTVQGTVLKLEARDSVVFYAE